MLECWEITYTETETHAGSRDDQKWVETQLITIKGNKTARKTKQSTNEKTTNNIKQDVTEHQTL